MPTKVLKVLYLKDTHTIVPQLGVTPYDGYADELSLFIILCKVQAELSFSSFMALIVGIEYNWIILIVNLAHRLLFL